MSQNDRTWSERLKDIVVGHARHVTDKSVYHKVSLAAFLAWVGLGSDPMSSSCYGPAAAFEALGQHHFLALFVALMSAATIFIISASYKQIIELFPTGGGGYLVASKLLGARTGAFSGCALLVDYVLTIALSIVSGTEAVFSFLPAEWQPWRLTFALIGLGVMTVLNVRGVRESVTPLVPLFLLFAATHVFIILFGLGTHLADFGQLARSTGADARTAASELGLFGMLFIVIRSFSMGAGTYTGIEAVSNGLPVLREPRVATAKRTMTYMAVSLSFMVVGLMLMYLLYRVKPDPSGTRTLNAVLLQAATGRWGEIGTVFVVVTLVSEAVILLIAAQTGFLDGPRVLANMAIDRWMPTRLSLLSDRLVIRNGVLLMSGAAALVMIGSHGRMEILIVLYSINVFITFTLSQIGMVRHWWQVRKTERRWRHGMTLNGIGMFLTGFILIWILVAKFRQGGWVTLLVTSGIFVIVNLIRRYYQSVSKSIEEFNRLAESVLMADRPGGPAVKPENLKPTPDAKTAVLLVSGFNGLGIHTMMNCVRYFGDTFKNYVFLSVGVVDAGNFKGAAEVSRLEEHMKAEMDRYVEIMRRRGTYAESAWSVGTDTADEIANTAAAILQKFPQSVFFAGQLIFAKDSFLTRLLHNNLVFTVQRRLYRRGIPFVILPFRV